MAIPVRSILRGVSAQQFERRAEERYAVQYALLAISEAARRLPLEMQARHGAIPWRPVEDLRNQYTHEYHHVDATMVWKTATQRRSELEKARSQERNKPTTRAAASRSRSK